LDLYELAVEPKESLAATPTKIKSVHTFP